MTGKQYDWKPFTKEEDAQLKKYYTILEAIPSISLSNLIGFMCPADQLKYIRVGPQGFVLTEHFLTHADSVWNMPLRPSDVFVVTYPRSGTTWTQELVWLVANDLNFEKAKSVQLTKRFPFLEFYMFFMPQICKELIKDEQSKKAMEFFMTPAAELLSKSPSPRFIKSHLPVSLMPKGTLETTKVVYVARDPRDVVVSLYHFFKSNKTLGIVCDFKHFYQQLFLKDLTSWSPFFEHVKEAWALRNHPNMLFIFYEELSQDLKGTAKRVAEYLGKDYTDKQFDELCEHLKFENFQKNKSVDLDDLKILTILSSNENNFIRKGKAGGWRDHFDEEMSQQAQRWMNDNLQDTDLRFPQQD